MNKAIYIINKNDPQDFCVAMAFGSKYVEMNIDNVGPIGLSKNVLKFKTNLCQKKEGVQFRDTYFPSAANPLHRDYPDAYCIKMSNENIGEYFPRIYRPQIESGHSINSLRFRDKIKYISSLVNTANDLPRKINEVISAVQQLETLVNRLKSILLNIYPTEKNLDAFGHEVRNLLILAATEVEAQLKGVMIANSVKASKSFYSTEDYCKLNKVLKLSRYKIRLMQYPELGDIIPFENWDCNAASKSLFWYNNYNAVKHDREASFDKATLKSAIHAVTAVCVALVAQYGNDIPTWRESIGSYFLLMDSPSWQIEECYVPPLSEDGWVAINHKI